MPSQHKHPPVSFRPPEGHRAWLYAYAEQTGQPVNRVLAAALAQYRRPVTGYLAGGPVMSPPDLALVSDVCDRISAMGLQDRSRLLFRLAFLHPCAVLDALADGGTGPDVDDGHEVCNREGSR